MSTGNHIGRRARVAVSSLIDVLMRLGWTCRSLLVLLQAQSQPLRLGSRLAFQPEVARPWLPFLLPEIQRSRYHTACVRRSHSVSSKKSKAAHMKSDSPPVSRWTPHCILSARETKICDNSTCRRGACAKARFLYKRNVETKHVASLRKPPQAEDSLKM